MEIDPINAELTQYLFVKRLTVCGFTFITVFLLLYLLLSAQTSVLLGLSFLPTALLWWADYRTKAETLNKFTHAIQSLEDDIPASSTKFWLCKVSGSTYLSLALVGLIDKEVYIWKISPSFHVPFLGLGPLTRLNLDILKEVDVTKIEVARIAEEEKLIIAHPDSHRLQLSFRSTIFHSFYRRFETHFVNQDLVYYGNRRRWASTKKVEEWKRIDTGLKNNFQGHSPYEFEQFIADLFTKMGYTAHTTSKSGDYGLDVIADNDGERIGIQAKRHKLGNKVGAPTVQKTLGAKFRANADKVIIVTTSTFTRNAREQARDAPIELWDKHVLKQKVEQHLIEEHPSSASQATL